MCGRFVLKTTAKAIQDQFQVNGLPEIEPRYNISPSQSILVVRISPQRHIQEFNKLQWGLIPAWMKEPPQIGMINARAETLLEKPSFRSAFRNRRCLIPADGFYEWGKLNDQKHPFFFQLRESELFAFAGLWEAWKSPEGEWQQTCAIITTLANTLMKPIHERMPVIISQKDYDIWLNCSAQSVERLFPLLRSYPSDEMHFYPVSLEVNNPRHDSLTCLQPI